MLRSVAVARIKRGLDFRTTGDDNIVLQLQESQRLLEKGKTLPRFLVQESEAFSATSGSAALTLPTGFIREVPDEGFTYYDTADEEYKELEKLSYNEAVVRFTGVDAGAPQAYVLRNSTVLIYPSRDTTYSLTWSYYKAADSLTSDIENAWLANNPEALIGHAGMVYARDLGNQAAMARFEQMFKEAWGGQFAEDILREADNDPLYLGGRL